MTDIEPAKKQFLEVRGFPELIGQVQCIQRLKAFGDLYASKNSMPEHILLIGADGIGKATFARAFAKTYNSGLRESDTKAWDNLGDLTATLTSIDSNEVLLLSNIQDLRKNMVERLQTALQEFRINLIIGKERREFPYQLNRFTLIATASKTTDVPSNILQCFTLLLSLEPYSNVELELLASEIAKRNGLTLKDGVAHILASVCQGSPAMIEQLLRRLLRLGKAEVTEGEAIQTLSALGLRPRSVTSADTMSADDLDNLTGIEFEKLITSLLQRMGFHAEMTRATGDGGIDIVAHLEKPFIGGRYLIQCKRYSPEIMVGAPIVREFYGACVADRKAIKGIFITTSAFTAQAHEFAQNLPVELIDGSGLKQLLAEYKSTN
jgi:Holliday junction resolvasome RuvABC ATP-dependent DNA helicase subunit